MTCRARRPSAALRVFLQLSIPASCSPLISPLAMRLTVRSLALLPLAAPAVVSAQSASLTYRLGKDTLAIEQEADRRGLPPQD